MKVDGKIVIITGGASGMGLAAVKAVHAAGGVPVIWDSSHQVNELSKALGVKGVCVDVANESAVEHAVKHLLQTGDRVVGLINCAGIAPAQKIFGRKGPMPLELFHKVIEVNLLGTFTCMQKLIPVMAENVPNNEGERGVIINTASIAAFEGQKGQVAYSAAKAGIVGMTLPAARDLASIGVRVMCIAPGLIETPLLQGLPQETCEALHQQTPFPSRFGKPEEFAALAMHIFANPMLNGETIRLDGALRMQP